MKNITIVAIENLISSVRLWRDANNAIAHLGGELYESPFGNALNHHINIVFDMIEYCRETPFVNTDSACSCFWDVVWNASDKNYETKITLDNDIQISFDSSVAIYDFFMHNQNFDCTLEAL